MVSHIANERQIAMKTEHSEACRCCPDCELRYGDSSFGGNRKSIKFAWFTANGAVARGGEFPVEALPQMIEMAVRCGYKFCFEKDAPA